MNAIVAARRHDVGREPWIPGTIVRPCSDCSVELFLSPSSQRLMDQFPGIPTLCDPCSEARVPMGQFAIGWLTQDAWEEFQMFSPHYPRARA